MIESMTNKAVREIIKNGMIKDEVFTFFDVVFDAQDTQAINLFVDYGIDHDVIRNLYEEWVIS